MLVFDEPTGNLDIANEEFIITEARKIAKEKCRHLKLYSRPESGFAFRDKFFFLSEGKLSTAVQKKS